MKRNAMKERKYIRWLEEVSLAQTAMVGGKNASLGDLTQTLTEKGVPVPRGFATTSTAYWELLRVNDMKPTLRALLDGLQSGHTPPEEVGSSIRRLFLQAEFPESLGDEIVGAYRELCLLTGDRTVDVAVRSSATAEDLPEASFAGMLQSFLNVRGEEQLVAACRRCYASLFTDRAISYGEKKGFDHLDIALSIGIQQMVRSDMAGAGVMFSVEPRSGFPNLLVITAAWGLGENVVQGAVIPDEYRVFKPLIDKPEYIPIVERFLGDKELKRIYDPKEQGGTKNITTSEQERASFVLDDEEILQLARWGCLIERHRGKAMDIEWAKDGVTGNLYVVQARPVTTQSLGSRETLTIRRLKGDGDPILTGISIGDGVASGRVCIIEGFKKIGRLAESSILVCQTANTAWMAEMRQKEVKGIVTDFGGRNSHSAVVSRELGIPCILGTLKATELLKPDQKITISCAEGDYGFIYDGVLECREKQISLKDEPSTRTRIMMNIVSEAEALNWWPLPCDGIGLVKMDAILRHIIQIHPMAMVHFDRVQDRKERAEIETLTRFQKDKASYFVDSLSGYLAEIAAAQYPEPVVVRLSDLNTREYTSLLGGKVFEPGKPDDNNDLRGASRYVSSRYREAFCLECRAIKQAREQMGLTNIRLLIPHCQDVEEADRVLEVLEEEGLLRGKKGLELHLSCDFSSNMKDVKAFATRFDGFSLALRRLRYLMGANENHGNQDSLTGAGPVNGSVRDMVADFFASAQSAGCAVTVWGRTFVGAQALVNMLVEAGVNALSVNPEAVPTVRRWVSLVETAGPM
jgi:pyruvate,water dikinase